MTQPITSGLNTLLKLLITDDNYDFKFINKEKIYFSLSKHTIDDRAVKDIVNLLIYGGYSGQSLEVLACDGSLYYKSMSIYSEFKKYFFKLNIKDDVVCKAYGKTIITETIDTHKVEYYVVHDNRSTYANILQK